MSKPHYDVVIATPGKMIHNAYVKSLLETTKWLNERGLTYKWLNRESSFIPSAREQVALDMEGVDWGASEIGRGEFTYGKIFWIDSDIEWDVEAFAKIYESDLDVVGGLYMIDLAGSVACAFFDKEQLPRLVNEKEFFMQDEPVEVFGIGFGFVAMKSGVFEKCSRPWFEIKHVKWEAFPVAVNVGEDYSWCMNARENGIKTYVDPTVRVKHHKGIIYEMKPA